jgi:hypothetical protein
MHRKEVEGTSVLRSRADPENPGDGMLGVLSGSTELSSTSIAVSDRLSLCRIRKRSGLLPALRV